MSPSNTPLDDGPTARLKTIVGQAGWATPDQGSKFLTDPRGRFQGQAGLVLRPNSTQQVSDIVSVCHSKHIRLIPHSGGTGVVAGQFSLDNPDAIILSMDRMNAIRNLSQDDGVLVAEAGCILENVHIAAESIGMTFPLNMASKGSCCIGGNLATNAGGIQVLRYGNARDLCLGLEAVLPDGSVYCDLNPLRKNNTGYDLRHLLIGSEGTLGIITAATLVLKPLDPERVTAFCALSSPDQSLAFYRHVRAKLGDSVNALELISGFGLTHVMSHFSDLRYPFDAPHPWAILLEASGPMGLSDHVQGALEDAYEQNLLQDVVIAQSETQRNALWDLRENTPEANRLSGAFCNSDTSVPVGRVPEFISRVQGALAKINPAIRLNSYGHLGDGNIHHNALPPEGMAKSDFVSANPGIIDQVRIAINQISHDLDGSISAEHGIGRLKPDDLQTVRTNGKACCYARDQDGIGPPQHNESRRYFAKPNLTRKITCPASKMRAKRLISLKTPARLVIVERRQT